MTFPVVIGGGKRIFDGAFPARALSLVEHVVTPSGAMIATYEPGGAIAHGWAGPQSTSDREAARQRRIADGSW